MRVASNSSAASIDFSFQCFFALYARCVCFEPFQVSINETIEPIDVKSRNTMETKQRKEEKNLIIVSDSNYWYFLIPNIPACFHEHFFAPTYNTQFHAQFQSIVNPIYGLGNECPSFGHKIHMKSIREFHSSRRGLTLIMLLK
ncbi:CLUMA_CG004453, isoform A [Clunio marinus]|uniref:CLUMA_CG004453, isoform A n=1 Tax=Clunio marinus TaxID=568069 RepID=A0A1J1HXA0_9DIPT|nr:CLUMA_CG004453, isoform A [Clunio marinus]